MNDSAAPSPVRPAPRRGRLEVFLGYWAGVGRTRAMLTAVERRLPPEARVLFAGAPPPAAGAPPRRFVAVDDFLTGGLDLDRLRRARPDLVLVPDLARRNPPNARHRWRHQDVARLLDAGIDVWTTLEVRQIASLADVIEGVLGAPQLETVPDPLLAAAEIELIDLPPAQLLDRCAREVAAATRAPLPAMAALVALREIALRLVADRLTARSRAADDRARRHVGGERLLVCVGPSPSSARVVRAAGRMAASLAAPWFALHVTTGRPVTPAEQRAVAEHLRLAEQLGATTAVVAAEDVAGELVAFATQHGVTRIVLGMTGAVQRSWFGGGRSLVERVMATSGAIDVFVIRGGEPAAGEVTAAPPAGRPWQPYALAGLFLAGGTGLGLGFDALGVGEAEVVLGYLLVVAAVAAWLGRGPAIFASCASVLLFNFFFTTPRFTFEVHDPGDLFTLGVLLAISVFVSTLTARVREQSITARQRERRTEQLYELGQDLSASTGPLQIATAAGARLRALLGGEVGIVLADAHGRLRPVTGGDALPWDAPTQELVRWVVEHGHMAGAGTETHAEAPFLAVPLVCPVGVVGVLLVRTAMPELLQLPDRRRLLENFAAQVALALQRERFAEQLHRTLAEAENERQRSAVLSTISHDFRTPLAAITGAASSLLDGGDRVPAEARDELLGSIRDEAGRLARLVDNLLQMTRIEAGRLNALREWHPVQDLVGSALTRVERQLAGREVTVAVPDELPLLRVDGVLFELVLVNLLDNAAKYSPATAPITVWAASDGAELRLAVADRGPGVDDADKHRVFEKFYRGAASRNDAVPGTGLGLAIAAAIVAQHGGELRAEDHAGGGACFVITLPIEAQPPAVPVEPSDGSGGGA
ncbi:MAG: sensor histidine kinase KdpD [Planctomycetes bacterium]|nr:sensor histidine kinase KdpD [Planctomycetota bacterium]